MKAMGSHIRHNAIHVSYQFHSTEQDIVLPNTAICCVGKGVLSLPMAEVPPYRAIAWCGGEVDQESVWWRWVLGTMGDGSSVYLKD
jgi:hypothetical protein